MNTINSGGKSTKEFDIADEPVESLLWLAFMSAVFVAVTGYYGFVLTPFEHGVDPGFWLMVDRLFCGTALYMSVMFTAIAVHKACKSGARTSS